MEIIKYQKLSWADERPVIAFYVDTNEQVGIYPSFRNCLHQIFRYYKNASPNLIGRFKKNGKPRTIGGRGKRKIYVQYFKGDFKKDFGINARGKRMGGGRLNPKWSKKNLNFRKLKMEYDKNKYARIKRLRSFDAMTGDIVKI